MDENGTILYSEVDYEMIHQAYTIPEDITFGDHVLTAIYISTDNLRAMDNKTLTISEYDEGGSDGEDTPDYSNNWRYFNPLRKDSHTKYSVTKIITTTNTHKVIHDNDIVTQSNVVTLDDLNKIFNQTFNNGHLLVYIDGELVFNGTTSDDLTTVIFEIIEKFLGQHEIKVEFTNADNDTKTYTEEITIQ